MTAAAAVEAPATTLIPFHRDPENPAALGYDPADPALAEARAAAAADPDLARELREVLATETQRFRGWAARWRRSGQGCCLSGYLADFIPASPRALLARARQAASTRRAFDSSGVGKVRQRLAAAQAAAESLAVALGEAKAILDRERCSPLGRFDPEGRAAAAPAAGSPARPKVEG